MRLRISENARWYLLGTGLAVILILLGSLQYRNNRQLRSLLQQQMRVTLQTSLMRVRHALEQQFTPLCNLLNPSRRDPSSLSLQRYAMQFAKWRDHASDPDLVSSVFVYQIAREGGGSLFRLQAGDPQFRKVDWPSSFQEMRAYLDKSSRSFSTTRDQHPHPGFPWYVDEDIPALIHPTFDSESSDFLSFVIAQINLTELSQHVLPGLVQRDLNSDGSPTYQLALVNIDKQRSVLYSSDPGFGAQKDLKPDVQLNVFGPPMPIVGREQAQNTPGMIADDLRIEFSRPSPGGAGIRQHPPRGEAFRGAAGGGADSSMADNRQFHLEPIRDRGEDRGWTLLAQHRKGSVEAAVSSLYIHNLSISFGVLIVLSVTIGTMVWSVRRAHQLARVRMDFVANVSHELRTPLTGIVSAAQNIADGLIDSKDRSMMYGSAILGQAQQLSDLIEQILLFSATDKGKQLYHFMFLNVADVVEAALVGTSSLLRTSHAKCDKYVEEDLPPVWGDFRALTQCVQNLISNAVKYGGSDPRLSVRVQAQETNHGHEVVITVEDQGVGISREDIEKIFQPFYRSAAATNAQVRGSGLGLSIARSIAEAMGGTLTVRSQLGTGSQFSVHLPANIKPGTADLLSKDTPAESAPAIAKHE